MGELANDLVGVWEVHGEKFLARRELIELRADGVMRRVVSPHDPEGDFDGTLGHIEEGSWSASEDVASFDFYNNSDYWDRRVWKISPSSISFYAEVGELGRVRPSPPWLRMACTGFGFDATELPDATTCAQLDEGECRDELDDPHADCLRSSDYWGEVAVCGLASTEPEPLVEVPNVVSFGHAGAFTCALLEDRTLTCWGQSQIVPPAGEFASVAAGGATACAIAVEGETHCWGAAFPGTSEVPDEQFEQVSVGPSGACGLTPGGTIACWGSVWLGANPAGVFVQVAVDDQHACARDAEGQVVCWGPLAAEYEMPTDSFSDIDLGSTTGCGVRSDDGRVACWTLPTTPLDDGRYVEVAVGRYQTCGLLEDGHITCAKRDLPLSQQSFDEVQVGHENLCGLRADGTLLCWGQQYHVSHISL